MGFRTRPGLFFRRNPPFNAAWRGRPYRMKQVEASAVREGDDRLVMAALTGYFMEDNHEIAVQIPLQ